MVQPLPATCFRGQGRLCLRLQAFALLAAPLILLLAGCGTGGVYANPGALSFSLSPGVNTIHGCTGCNATNALGRSVHRFTTTLPDQNVTVKWSLSGGDAVSGPGTINAAGEYVPPAISLPTALRWW